MKQCTGTYQPLRRTGAYILAILLVAFTAPIATGLVLCICHDGHVSLEDACNPTLCCPPVDCDAPTPVGVSMDVVPPAHACVDLLLESPSSPVRSARQDTGLQQCQPEMRALPLTYSVVPLSASPVSVPEGRADATPASITQARTVVLTI